MTDAHLSTLPLVLPASCGAVAKDKTFGCTPYSKCTVVGMPFGLTVPLRLAEPLVTNEAAVVVACGKMVEVVTL